MTDPAIPDAAAPATTTDPAIPDAAAPAVTETTPETLAHLRAVEANERHLVLVGKLAVRDDLEAFFRANPSFTKRETPDALAALFREYEAELAGIIEGAA